MKPETFTESLKAALGSRLQAVVLYGSSAAGDYIEDRSDYNVLLLANDWSLKTLNSIREITGKWQQAGNPAPLCFTPKRFADAVDVFPMEMLDIIEAHRVLHGENPLKSLKVDRKHLRHQVEFELRSKLLQLRQSYLQMRKPEKAVPELLVNSLSSMQSVCRGALRLFDDDIPTDKTIVISQLGEQLEISLSAFSKIQDIKQNPTLAKSINCIELYGLYLDQIEGVLDHVDNDSND